MKSYHSLVLLAATTQANETRGFMNELSQIYSEAQDDNSVTNLAQVQTETPDVCTKAQTRVVDGDTPFYNLAGKGTYTDASFPPTSTEQLYYAEDSEFYRSEEDTTARWYRLYTQTNGGRPPTLWGEKGPKASDVDQGAIDDGWFMAALQAYAQAGKVEGNFLNIELSESGIYAVKLYPLGVPVHIVVDDSIPFQPFGPRAPLFAKYGEDNAIWPIIMEKAMAKLHGNYSRLEGGLGSEGVSYLNGSPYYEVYSGAATESQYWDWVKGARRSRWLVTVKSKCSGSDKSKDGLVSCHTYTITDQAELPNGVKLYRLSNPWGREQYSGRYSDRARGYKALPHSWLSWLNEHGYPHEKGDDGEFWMSSKDFHRYTERVIANPDVEELGWHHDWHLVLNDDGADGVDGQWDHCGEDEAEECVRYIAEVKNESLVSNTIWIGLHTWEERTYGASNERNECYQDEPGSG